MVFLESSFDKRVTSLIRFSGTFIVLVRLFPSGIRGLFRSISHILHASLQTVNITRKSSTSSPRYHITSRVRIDR